MFTLNPEYALPEQAAETRTPRLDQTRCEPQNRVGNFFPEMANRVGHNQPATLIITIEIDLYVYESASDVHIYLYANANPAMYLDPSGNVGISSIGAALYTHSLLLSMTSATTSFLVASTIQARVVSIAGPLSRELDLLALELSFFDPVAAYRISGLSSAIKANISAGMIARNIAVPTLLAALPAPYNTTGFVWSGLSGYNLVSMLFAVNAAAFSEINFSKGGVSVHAKADLHTTPSFFKTVLSVRSPAKDIGAADDALRSLREGRLGDAKSQFQEVVSNLSNYGSASAKVSVTAVDKSTSASATLSGGGFSTSTSGF